MGTPHRKDIGYLRERLPTLTIAQSGEATWANLWFAGARIATKQVDSRIFELAETDYHHEVMTELLDKFATERAKTLSKSAVPKPKTDAEAEGLATKVAKKITGKKKTSKKA